MKKYLFSFTIIASFSLNGIAQQLENNGWCIAHEQHLKLMASDPQYAKNQQDLEVFTQTFEAERLTEKKNSSQSKTESVVKIIPVVFHIIHINGSENISTAQILDQINILNKDFRRLNTDTNKTPGPFKSIAADCEIEFRLAQKDPNGNCTSGIERIYSPITLDARDNVKALSVWPANKYLNVWVVSNIQNSSGGPGVVGGYAQFPGGSASTDGVVIRSNFVGSIGTAAGNGNLGRVTTHEVGHWLNLRHIWGDDAGSCSGSDMVSDTPNQGDMSFSTCPTFPALDACTPAGNGILFSDYMDYTVGNCQNTFTAGQSIRMNSSLTSSVSGRNNLWSPANILATGADATPELCTADFSTTKKIICAGGSVTFTDISWNTTPTSWEWDFNNDGTTDATIPNPTYTYSIPGVYSVKLTVGDGTTTKTVTKSSYIAVLADTASAQPPFSEGFENTGYPYNDWYNNSISSSGTTWGQVTTAGYTGNASLKLDNHSPASGDVDAFITPAINMSNVTSPTMSFRVAYQRRSVNDTLDQLKVLTSINCGASWTTRMQKGSSALQTVTNVSSAPFTPSSTSQWRLENVTIPNLAGKPSARVKFEFTGFGVGNNIYIDDINITGILSVEEEFINGFGLNVFPNPFSEQTTISFNIRDRYTIAIGVYDILGKEVISLSNSTELTAGSYSLPLTKGILNPGIYFVKLNVNDYSIMRKVIVQ